MDEVDKWRAAAKRAEAHADVWYTIVWMLVIVVIYLAPN